MMIKRILIFIITTLVLISCTSCEPSDVQIIDMLSCIDSTPPSLVSIEGVSSYAFNIVFSEPLGDRDDFIVEFNDKETTNFSIDGCTLIIYSNNKLIPGEKYHIKVEAVDKTGNSIILESQCFSKNLNPAKLLISEISTKGTSKYEDRVELICTESGNLAGITIADGFNYNWEDRCVLPNIQICCGELIVVCFGTETEADYRSEKEKGLSSNNGCIVISQTPDVSSPIQDCIVYSNKTSTTFSGFANSHVEETANALMRIGEWETSSYLSESAVNTTYETSTRSINRRSDAWGNFQDTNTQNDFYTTVTSGQSFGLKNNPNEYQISGN